METLILIIIYNIFPYHNILKKYVKKRWRSFFSCVQLSEVFTMLKIFGYNNHWLLSRRLMKLITQEAILRICNIFINIIIPFIFELFLGKIAIWYCSIRDFIIGSVPFLWRWETCHRKWKIKSWWHWRIYNSTSRKQHWFASISQIAI